MKYSWSVQSGRHLQAATSGGVVRNLFSNMNSSRPQNTNRASRKPKRFRSAFTTEQINYLEQQFKKFPYISSEHRKEIATALNMQERAIKIWFQNRRMKEKKETSNKEDGTNNDEFDKHRLHNVWTLPSVNDQISYSLPVIVKPTVDRTATLIKANTNSVQRNKTNAIPQSTTRNQFSGIKYHLTSPFLSNKNPRYKPATLTIETSKQEKKEAQKQQVSRKLEVKESSSSSKLRPVLEDVPSNKKPRTSHIPLKVKQTEVKGSAYFPVMPTSYAHPFISSGGIIWKPVNVMPVLPTGTAVPSQERLGSSQNMSCNCNCHETFHSYAVPPNPINPYAQYVVTTPFPNPSPKF